MITPMVARLVPIPSTARTDFLMKWMDPEATALLRVRDDTGEDGGVPEITIPVVHDQWYGGRFGDQSGLFLNVSE